MKIYEVANNIEFVEFAELSVWMQLFNFPMFIWNRQLNEQSTKQATKVWKRNKTGGAKQQQQQQK